jgi:hypothetical protein
MVSYTEKPKNHLVAHVSDTGLHQTGISYNLFTGVLRVPVWLPLSPRRLQF